MTLDININDYYMSLTEEQMLNENVADLIKYMNTIKDNTDETDRVKSIIAKYQKQMNCLKDNYGQNYEEAVAGKAFGPSIRIWKTSSANTIKSSKKKTANQIKRTSSKNKPK